MTSLPYSGEPVAPRLHVQASSTLLDRLKALHPKSIDLSLGRIERLLAALGSPEKQLPPVFHVAGTNGKGSFIAFLRAIAEAPRGANHAVRAIQSQKAGENKSPHNAST